MTIPLPNLIELVQTYPSPPRLDFSAVLAEQFQQQGLCLQIAPGMRIAVGVGSRGIANLQEIVRATVSLLTAAGARPFVIPAMGSHGGATPAVRCNSIMTVTYNRFKALGEGMKIQKRFLPGLLLLLPFSVWGQSGSYDGMNNSLSNIYRTSDAKTYSISPENLTGEKGKGGMATEGTGAHAARELGQGWKVSPSIRIEPGQTFTLADISGSGEIEHIWMTPTGNWRLSILHMYWDDETDPSVEVPVGDFFAMGWGKFASLSSLAVCVNPGSAFNSYWPMPFRKHARLTLENLDDKQMTVYYQIDYSKAPVAADAAYFHAQFRRVNPVQFKQVYTILDGVQGKGQYVGTYLAWGVHNNGWWGEGEIKFYLDGDKEFPTINGTGTEDYFNGSYNFENSETHQYQTFTSPYSGLAQVIKPDGLYQSQQRFGLYRWHIPDPIRFDHDLRVTIQDLGWQSGGRYLPEMDDISSVAYWYQTEPHAPFPKLPTRDELAIN